MRAEEAERQLRLSDAWMEHLSVAERHQHENVRWYALALQGAAAIGWGVAAVANENERGPRASTYGLAAGAALSVGFAAGSLFTSDLARRAGVARWGIYAQGVAAGPRG